VLLPFIETYESARDVTLSQTIRRFVLAHNYNLSNPTLKLVELYKTSTVLTIYLVLSILMIYQAMK